MEPHDNHASITAGLLVGGHSRRMGRPKALLATASGLTWLEHVATTAGRASHSVVLVGAFDDVPLRLATVPRIGDAEIGVGPVAGLLSLLEYTTTPWALLLACDMPLLTVDVLETLVAHTAESAAVVCFGRAGGVHPCCALYRPRLIDTVRAVVQACPNAGLHRIIEAVQGVHVLTPTASQTRALTNINTPEELPDSLDGDLC